MVRDLALVAAADDFVVGPGVPFWLDADAGEVAIEGEDQSAAKGVDHAVDLGLNQLAVAGREDFLDVDRREERGAVLAQEGAEVVEVVDSGLVELEAVDAGLQERFQDFAVLAAGVHDDRDAEVVGEAKEACVQVAEEFVPHRWREEQSALGAHIFAEEDGIGLGVAGSEDKRLIDVSQDGVQPMQVFRIQRHVHQVVVHAADVPGLGENPAGQASEPEMVALVFGKAGAEVLGSGFAVKDRRREVVEVVPVSNDRRDYLAAFAGVLGSHPVPDVAPDVIVVFIVAFNPALLDVSLGRARAAADKVVAPTLAKTEAWTRLAGAGEIGLDDVSGSHGQYSGW